MTKLLTSWNVRVYTMISTLNMTRMCIHLLVFNKDEPNKTKLSCKFQTHSKYQKVKKYSTVYFINHKMSQVIYITMLSNVYKCQNLCRNNPFKTH